MRLMMGAWGVWAVFLSLFAGMFTLAWLYSESAAEARVPGIIALTAWSLVALLWLLALRRALWIAALRRDGIATPARVTGHTKTGNSSGGGAIYRADWQTVDGLTGRTIPLRRGGRPEIGSMITILVDPNGRRGGVWEAEV